MSQDKSGSSITAALITAIAMIVVAIIGYLGTKLQVETPIRATQTAQPPTVVVTVNSPKFTVNNRLLLPISISIDEGYVGDVQEQSTKVFVLESYPVKVSWSIVKVSLSNGVVLSDDMGGHFNGVSDNEIISIDNIVGEQPYFYLIVSNKTDKNCSVIINYSWASEFVTHAQVAANKSNVGFGYYKLYSNSNVTLNCEGKVYWWGKRSGEEKGAPFYEKVENDTGRIYFTLNP